MEGSHTVNFIRLQLNANATYSSGEITLSHDDTNAHGSDSTGYYVVRESVYLKYIAGNKTATAIERLIPSELIIHDDTVPYLPETFSHYKLNDKTGPAVDALGYRDIPEQGTVGYIGGPMRDISRGPYTYTTNYFRSTGTFSGSAYDTLYPVIEGWFKCGPTGSDQTIFSKYWSGGYGWIANVSAANKMQIYLGASTITSVADYTDNEWHYFFFAQLAVSGTDKRRLYVDDTVVSASGVNFSFTGSYLEIGARYGGINPMTAGYVGECTFGSGLTSWDGIDEYVAKRFNNGIGRPLGDSNGFTPKYKVENLSNVDKAVLLAYNDRADTTNQNPNNLWMGGLLY